MTTIEEIIVRAKDLGLPVAEFEFRNTKQHPAPDPPFIVYLKTEKQRGSDEKNRIREIAGSIELYTDRIPDKKLEERIEKEVLFDVEFEKNIVLIRDENMAQAAYDFVVIQKK